MVRQGSIKTIVRSTAALAFVLLALYGAGLLRQHLFRRRVERLLQDTLSLDLQRGSGRGMSQMLERWGAWGRPEGACSWRDCRYNIILNAPSYILSPELFEGRHKRAAALLMQLQQLRARLPGLWYARLEVSLVVQDGRLVQARRELLLSVPPRARTERPSGYPLIVILGRSKDLASGFGRRSQLADHPNYRVGAPQGAGCDCLMAKILYTPATTAEELRKLTDFDLSCLTRLRPCVWLEQLLPTARAWNLYGWPDAPLEDPRIAAEKAAGLSKPRVLPVWVTGRDALELFVVQVLSRDGIRCDTGEELATVRLVGTLKGEPLWPVESTLQAAVLAGYAGDPERNLKAGRRYVFVDAGGLASNRTLEVEPYDVLEDTPQVEGELRRGMAQSDPPRGPEPY